MTRLEITTQKILNQGTLTTWLLRMRFLGKRIVFTNGCFDLLHLGHVDYLSRARDLGDLLVIGLNSDDSVRRLKGPSRPINDEHSRAMVLASLGCVDAVILFHEDNPAGLIRHIQPQVLVKGGDYRADEIAGYESVTSGGGEVVILPFVEGYSTSEMEARIRTSR